MHVLVPLSCWIFLGENDLAAALVGIALVLFGLMIVAKPAARLEEKLVTLFAGLLIFVTVSCFVAGQILLKHAMDIIGANGLLAASTRRWCSRRRSALFAVNFFINLGLLQRFDLSFIFPFQGLSVIMIALAGAFILKEKLTLRLTIGSIVISAGVILVSLS